MKESKHNIKNELFDEIKTWYKNNFRTVIKIFAYFFTFVYLISVVVGIIDKDKRLKPSDLGLIGIVLLINSDVLERLKKLQLNKDGVDIELERKLTANLNVNQKEADALAYLGQVLLVGDKYKEEREKFFDSLLNDGDKKLLEKFLNAEKNNEKLLYEESTKLSLSHLYLLGFIQNKRKDTVFPIDGLTEGENLKHYFRLTDVGKTCLELSSD